MTKSSRLSKNDWLRMGLFTLVHGGPQALKAEPLARAMRTTKGSFYWHFKDVGDFRNQMFDLWEQRAYSDIVTEVDQIENPRERLRALGQLAANAAPNEYGGAALEPAIRAWARADSAVAQAVQRVDTRRIDYLAGLLSQIGLTNPDFARIIYAAHLGFDDLDTLHSTNSLQPRTSLIDLILALE